jgi:hypothetical protein
MLFRDNKELSREADIFAKTEPLKGSVECGENT